MGGKIAQIFGEPAGRTGELVEELVLVAPAPPVPIAAPKEQREAMLESYQSPAGVEFALSILTSRQLSPELRQQVIDDTLSGSPAAKAAWTAENQHDAGSQRHRWEYQCPNHRHRRGCRQSGDQVSPETGARPSHQRNRILRSLLLQEWAICPRWRPRARWRPPSQRRYRQLVPANNSTAASQERDEPWASLHPKYKVAVVQAAPGKIDLDGTVAKTIRYIEEAAKEGAKLIGLYPKPGFQAILGTSGWERRRGRSGRGSYSATSTIP